MLGTLGSLAETVLPPLAKIISEVASEGAAAIAASFDKIALAAKAVSSATISVSGVEIPGNAEGTDNWKGGWIRMNEDGGELSHLFIVG